MWTRLAVGAGAAVAAATYWTAWHEPRRLIVNEHELRPSGWPPALDGLRVGLVSDLHAGLGHTNPARVGQPFALLNDQRRTSSACSATTWTRRTSARAAR